MAKLKELIKKIKFEHICIIAIFIFMLIIHSLAPITGDDWGNAAPKFSFIGSIESAIGSYWAWEGRIVGRVFINIMAPRKIIYNILTAIIMASIVYFAYKLIDNKKNQKYPILLFIIAMLLVNRHVFGQTYTWIAGGVTYLYPTAIVLGIIAHLFNKKDTKFNLIESIILIILSLAGTCFVENIGVALICTWLLYIIYNYIVNKKFQVVPIICLLCSIVTFIIMICSPGSANRMMETPQFVELSIIGKIMYNLDNCVQFLYARNAVLVLLMLIPINNIINKKIKKKQIKIPIMIILNAFYIASILQNIQYMIPVNINRLNFGQTFILNSKKITIPFWSIFTILFLYSIVDTYKENRKKLIMYIGIFIVGLSTIFSMFLSPVWGDRISVFNIFCLYIISISLISNIVKTEKTAKIEKILIGILVCVCIYYLVIFVYVAHTQNLREQEIKQCIDNNEKVLYLTESPILLMQNYNPQIDYFIDTYKKCYNIPEDVEIKLKSSEIELKIRNFINK